MKFGRPRVRPGRVAHGHEYVSFIVLLFTLFTISGGIYLTGNLVATPKHNLTFLVMGAVLASFIGTMGASMVLIRPLLRANSERNVRQAHRHLLHLRGEQRRRTAHAAGGPAPLPGLPSRSAVRAGRCGCGREWLLAVGLVLVDLLAVEFYLLPQGARGGPADGPAGLRPDAPQGRHEHRSCSSLVIITIIFSEPLGRVGRGHLTSRSSAS